LPNASKQKGGGLKREIVAILRDHGIAAEKVPLSGPQSHVRITPDCVAKLALRRRTNVIARFETDVSWSSVELIIHPPAM